MGAASPETDTPSAGLIPDFSRVQPLFMLVLGAELLAIVLVLAAAPLQGFDWSRLGLWSLFVQWCALTSALGVWAARAWLVRQPPALALGTLFVMALSVTGAVTLGSIALMSGWRFGGPWLGHLLSNLLICALVVGAVLRYLYLGDRLRRQQQAVLAARLDALQARIRPHFLFNSMNSIAALIATDPARAETAVEDLSALFRASLKAGAALVPLHEELDLCERYLRIEAARLGDRLQVEWDVDPATRGAALPLLSLQPLVENAVYHGIQPRLGGGCVRLATRLEGELVQVVVDNPAAPAHEPVAGHGMAVDNIRARLRTCFGERAHLKLEDRGDRHLSLLSFPLTSANPVAPWTTTYAIAAQNRSAQS